MSSESIRVQNVEVLSPAEHRTIREVMQSADALAGLSPWERRRLELQVRRERKAVVLQLVRIESQALVAEAIALAVGRRHQAEERAATETLAEQLRCLKRAGQLREEAMHEVAQLSEDSREWARAAISSVTHSYAVGMSRRATGDRC